MLQRGDQEVCGPTTISLKVSVPLSISLHDTLTAVPRILWANSCNTFVPRLCPIDSLSETVCRWRLEHNAPSEPKNRICCTPNHLQESTNSPKQIWETLHPSWMRNKIYLGHAPTKSQTIASYSKQIFSEFQIWQNLPSNVLSYLDCECTDCVYGIFFYFVIRLPIDYFFLFVSQRLLWGLILNLSHIRIDWRKG